MLTVAVLLSGSGRTLQNLLDLSEAGELPIRIGLVISSSKKAYGLERAAKAGVHSRVFRPRDFPTTAAYAQANTVPGEEPFSRDALVAGGSAQVGEDLFRNHPAAPCARCHNVDGRDNVGPDLSTVGSLHTPGYLLTALLKPDAHIAAGYASTAVTLKDGSIKTGRLVQNKSTPAELVLANADGVEQVIARVNIQGVPVTSTQSLMPTMQDKLSPAEMRDVMAYLVSLKGSGEPGAIGPSLVSPAKSLAHHIVLPVILLAIFVALGALLLLTVLGGGAARA